jgi:glutaredoxin
MEFIEPGTDFTIYSKSGCPNCTHVKKLLTEKNKIFIVVDCDEYIIEDKAALMQFISKLANKEIKSFPIVFDNKEFIGGFAETKDYLQKSLDFTDSF